MFVFVTLKCLLLTASTHWKDPTIERTRRAGISHNERWILQSIRPNVQPFCVLFLPAKRLAGTNVSKSDLFCVEWDV